MKWKTTVSGSTFDEIMEAAGNEVVRFFGRVRPFDITHVNASEVLTTRDGGGRAYSVSIIYDAEVEVIE